MGYFTIPAGGTGHRHANQSVLEALHDAGSGAVITAAERAAIDGAFAPPPGTAALWNGTPPETLQETVSRLAVLLAKHLGTLSEPTP